MDKLLRTGILITFGVLIIGIIGGCGDSPTEAGDELEKIDLVATVPENGGIVSEVGELKMTFEGFPKSVYVEGKPAIIQGSAAIVKITDLPNIIPGTEKTVTVEWRNQDNFLAGSKTITFTVLKPVTVMIDPAPGPLAYINHGQELILQFSAEVFSAKVNGRSATGSGRDWRVWSNHVPYGQAEFLNIEWINRDGAAEDRRVGPYYVADICFADPAITSGTVADGDADVDPAPINAAGFRFDFDEAITGTIKLTDEAGVDLNWIGNVGGQTATLTAVAGQELVNGTTYKIEIDFQDGAGNALVATITFVTKPK